MKRIEAAELREKIYEELLNGSGTIHELRDELGGCYDSRLMRMLAEEMVELGWLVREYPTFDDRRGAIRYAVAYTKKVAA